MAPANSPRSHTRGLPPSTDVTCDHRRLRTQKTFGLSGPDASWKAQRAASNMSRSADAAVGASMLFFPGRLAALEARLDKWYSTRHLLPPTGESMRYPLDRVVEGAPRAAGWAITAASLLVAVAMAVLLAGRYLG